MVNSIIVSDTSSASQVIGVHGGSGLMHWKRFVTGLMMHAAWDSFEHNRLEPGAAVGEHVHTRTEEIYFIVSGKGMMKYDGEEFEVVPGDLIMTPLNGRHGITNHGSEPLDFVVVEALPPSIVNALPEYSPSVNTA
jgi:mannose-6-phosphate isomerase-like protein (cupin superfamily)